MSTRLNELTAANERLNIEVTLERERFGGSSSAIRDISSRLQETIEILNKPRKDYKPVVVQLKTKIKKLETYIEDMKISHLKELCELQREKDRMLEEAKNGRIYSQVNESQVDSSEDISVLKENILSLQRKLEKQYDDSDAKQQKLEAQLSEFREVRLNFYSFFL